MHSHNYNALCIYCGLAVAPASYLLLGVLDRVSGELGNFEGPGALVANLGRPGVHPEDEGIPPRQGSHLRPRPEARVV